MTNKTNKQTKLKNTLNKFLFNAIKNDPNYQAWQQNFVIPNFISDNLAKPLRDYQIQAVKHFIYLYEEIDPSRAKHVLFNMATGTGKTLTMAAIVLYLHELGYCHFVFLVHQNQILEQAKKNFTEPNFDKYLFKKQVKFHGKKTNIKAVSHFNHRSDDIQFMFLSTAMLYNHLTNPKENSVSIDDFKEHKTVIIADEAHRLNVDTRKKLKKSDEDNIRNWETAVQSAINAKSNNLLLEFTATVDLKNEYIHKKYSDKLIYKYDFIQFNKEGFSKNVAFLYNDETQIEDQKRLLIVNAVALSEYRRLYAERTMQVRINPIVLIKSTTIKQSYEDKAFFHQVIGSLKAEDLNYLKDMANRQQDLFDNNMIKQMFSWLADKRSGFMGVTGLVGYIRERFAENNTLIYNNKSKERADLLPLLDSPKNTIRAIFSVNALNEGWDVLSLYDIIHFDISANKKVSLQDIQLIGRGARLYPYDLPKNYKNEDNLFGDSYEFDRFKRKFDNAPDDNGRVLETFYYHFVKTGTFLDNLTKDLLGEGIINEGVEKRTIQLKPQFLASQTYNNGFVLVNSREYRSKNDQREIDLTFKREIIASPYQVYLKSLTDKEQNKKLSATKYKNIKITDDYFSRHLLYKALMIAENGFFRLNNLKKHLVGIDSIDVMIDDYLPMCDIQYSYIEGKDIDELSAYEKLNLLIGSILPEVRKAIDKHLPTVVGSPIFTPKPLSAVFQKQKHIYLVAYPSIDDMGKKVFIAPDERAKGQSSHDNSELHYNINKADWYAYNENYGTSEEKRFVKFIASHIDALKQNYPTAEIYLIRNELDYYLFNIDDGRRFSPDYMMIINDTQNKKLYYQCLFEPKGGHLLEKDNWKESALINLNNESQTQLYCDDMDSQFLEEIEKQGYQEIKCLGFKFFNSDIRGINDFAIDFTKNLLK